MAQYIKLFLMFAFALFFVACGMNTDETRFIATSPIRSASITPISTTTPTLVLTATSTPMLLATTTPITTAPITPTATAAIWSTFTYNNGSPRVSIDYPVGWNVEVFWPSKDPDQLIWAKLYPPNNTLTGGINFQVYQFDKRLDPRDPPDPMIEVWCPIPWYRSIATKDADGILYLTCPKASSDPRFIVLSSYYYSEKYKLEIYISHTMFVDATILQSSSITDTISQQYGVFEHMVESVRLTEPN